jgi:hypothetical protein
VGVWTSGWFSYGVGWRVYETNESKGATQWNARPRIEILVLVESSTGLNRTRYKHQRPHIPEALLFWVCASHHAISIAGASIVSADMDLGSVVADHLPIDNTAIWTEQQYCVSYGSIRSQTHLK